MPIIKLIDMATEDEVKLFLSQFKIKLTIFHIVFIDREKNQNVIDHEKVIESPFADGNATLVYETKEVEFRGSKYTVTSCYYKCDITGEEFTTTEQDELWITQIHNQYREKYGIPYPDEILSMREKVWSILRQDVQNTRFLERISIIYMKRDYFLMKVMVRHYSVYKILKFFRALVENSIHQFTEKKNTKI